MNKKALVIRSISGFFDLFTEEKTIIRTTLSGNLKNLKTLIYVGDYVLYNENNVIIKLLERKNYLIRPKVANIDLVLLVCAATNPHFSSFNLDKILCNIEFQNILPCLIFTKCDLAKNKFIKEYQQMNYLCFEINNLNLDENTKKIILNKLENKICVFSGNSGVGKSSTINNLLNWDQKIGSLSSILRGKHTTRVIEMIIKDNYFFIDTPGFSSFELSLTKEEVKNSFFIFKENAKKCGFGSSCMHLSEIDCEIKKMVKLDKIPYFRYKNYCKIINSVREKKWMKN